MSAPVDSDEGRWEVELERLKLADRHFLHDLQQFWQRARMFVLVQGALFSVFTSIGDKDQSDQQLDPLLVALGFGVAVYWGWISYLTAGRIREWREVVIGVDKALGGRHMFEDAESHAQRSGWQNPTSVANGLPWAIAVMWLVAALVRFA